MRRSLYLIAAYLVWIFVFRLIVLTIVTYLMQESGAHFREISDTFNNNLLLFHGMGAALFVLFLLQINPLTIVTRHELYSRHQFQRQFIPGWIRGFFIAALFTGLFILVGTHNYVGFLIQEENIFVAIMGLSIRFLSLFTLVYCEEFIFRYQWFQLARGNQYGLRMILISALLYALTKAFQFNLGVSQIITIVLAGLYLGLRSAVEMNFFQGAGLWSGFLVALNIVFSFPLFGNEAQGLLFVQYFPSESGVGEFSQFLSGGAGGPLSSFLTGTLLTFAITYEVVRSQKDLFSKGFRT